MPMLTCSICGVAHDPSDPHDAATVAFQLYFYRVMGRVPTWEDAMAHCSEETKDLMRQLLRAWNIDPKAPADMRFRRAPD